MTDTPPLLPTGRRSFIGAALAVSALPRLAGATDRDWSGRTPTRYPEPDVEVLDPRFARYRIGNTPIQRLYTGMLWAEGPAWNPVGHYLVWSDIPNDTQLRWLEEDGHVSVLRRPSGNSNGNCFDRQGRQLSCEHANRRVVRYEHDGSVTVLAERWNGKPLNAPNDVVVHPDGGVWFTDPGYGSMGDYEGNKGDLEIKEAVYRIDPQTGALDAGDRRARQAQRPLLLAGLEALYVADTGSGSTHGIHVFDVMDGQGLANGRSFTNMVFRGKTGGADGIRGRRRRQHLGERGLGRRRLRRRPRVRSRRHPHRAHQAARDLRERVLRRREAQPPVHGRQPVALRGLRRDPRRGLKPSRRAPGPTRRTGS